MPYRSRAAIVHVVAVRWLLLMFLTSAAWHTQSTWSTHSVLFAQSETQSTTSSASAPADASANRPAGAAEAQDNEKARQPERVRKTGPLRLAGITMAPFSRARAGYPLSIQAIISNDADNEQSGMVSARLDNVPNLQSTNRFTVPPHSKTIVEAYLMLPDDLAALSTVDLNVSLRSPDAVDRVLVDDSGRPLIDTLKVPMDREKLFTAAITEDDPPALAEWDWPYESPRWDYEMFVAARVDSSHTRRILSISHSNLPHERLNWDTFDAIVISQDWPFRDLVAMNTMKRWIASGGRAWITLDSIDATSLQALLPDGMSCSVIDDIEMSRCVIDTSGHVTYAEADRTIETSEPVRMRRVIAQGGEVTHSVNGFPAAIWFRIGRGQVLVTTLGAAAWIRPRTVVRNSHPLFDHAFEMQPWAVQMVQRFYEIYVNRLSQADKEIDYPVKLIGNPVLDRSFVMRIVLSFCGALLLAGLVCWQRGMLVHMGWIVPILSIVASVPILFAASTQRRDIADTSANLQLIEVNPGSQIVQGQQWTATYNSSSYDGALDATGDVTLDWYGNNQQSDMRRWAWLDFHHWQLHSSGWPTGIWKMSSRFDLPLAHYDIEATLDAKGLQVKLPEDLPVDLEDAVLEYVPGDPIPCGNVSRQKAVLIAESQLSSRDSWLGSNIVNDEQARRDEVYRRTTARGIAFAYPSYPALLGWTPLWKVPLNWQPERSTRGSALVVLPVRLNPVASGTDVRVPHSVIRVETPQSIGSFSTAFFNTSGWWGDATSLPASVPIRFHLPSQACPLDVREIECQLQIRAPQRNVRVYARTDANADPIHKIRVADPGASHNGWKQVLSKSSPLGLERFTIQDKAVSELARSGSIDFIVDISNLPGLGVNEVSDQVAEWQVDFFRINVSGTVAQREEVK